jgi:3-isopropylmalate dehydrogenase
MPRCKIAVIQGDGVGPEIVPEALRALKTLQELYSNLDFEFLDVAVGARKYRETGVDLSRDQLKTCSEADAILKGPIGLPDVRYDDGTEVGIHIELMLRFQLDLYANLRPVFLQEGVQSRLREKKPGEINYLIVRENTEGLYLAHMSGIRRNDLAIDPLVVTERGVKRIVKFAFELAGNTSGAPSDGRRRVTCVDKSNVLRSYAFFREKFDGVAKDYPNIERQYMYVDAMTQYMLFSPEKLNVIVTENFIGDILSDLGSATVGGLGLAGSANLGDDVALFEAVHGSAPDIAGKGIANPIAILFATAHMLEWLKQAQAANTLRRAIGKVLAEGKVRTPDLGGSSSTKQVGEAISNAMKEVSLRG